MEQYAHARGKQRAYCPITTGDATIIARAHEARVFTYYKRLYGQVSRGAFATSIKEVMIGKANLPNDLDNP